MARPFAIFDIDGTIFRWQLFHELIFQLIKAGKLPQEIEEKIAEPLHKWQNRAVPDAFRQYETALLQALKYNLRGASVAATKQIAKKIIDESGDKVYIYTRDQASSLQQQGYFLIAISGSFQEIVDLFGKKYGFDVAIGVQSEHKDGVFTGEVVETYNRKGELLKEVVKQHNLTWAGSIGVGDSGNDTSMLELVEQPLAFNPDKRLLAHAMERGWDITVERKSIAYHLKAKDGTYYLNID